MSKNLKSAPLCGPPPVSAISAGSRIVLWDRNPHTVFSWKRDKPMSRLVAAAHSAVHPVTLILLYTLSPKCANGDRFGFLARLPNNPVRTTTATHRAILPSRSLFPRNDKAYHTFVRTLWHFQAYKMLHFDFRISIEIQINRGIDGLFARNTGLYFLKCQTIEWRSEAWLQLASGNTDSDLSLRLRPPNSMRLK